MAKDVSALLPESSGLIITLLFLALRKVNGPGYSPGGKCGLQNHHKAGDVP